jgi:hypothetical protein
LLPNGACPDVPFYAMRQKLAKDARILYAVACL